MREQREPGPHETCVPSGQVLDNHVRQDLRRKQELLSAACRCLDDEQSYRFFDTLASVAQLALPEKTQYLAFLEASGEYGANEMEAVRRLISGEGAAAFRDLVDMVRDIRVKQEIDAMVA